MEFTARPHTTLVVSRTGNRKFIWSGLKPGESKAVFVDWPPKMRVRSIVMTSQTLNGLPTVHARSTVATELRRGLIVVTRVNGVHRLDDPCQSSCTRKIKKDGWVNRSKFLY